MAALLDVHGLTVRYGALAAVDDVSFSVESGSFTALIGPNGAGKTTFIDAVTGLTRSEGSVVFDGGAIEGLPAFRRARLGLARTFQSLELFEDLTIEENLLAAADRPSLWFWITDLVRPRIHGAAAASVRSALELLNLTDIAHAMPPELSLGRRKLVTVARALALRPRLLLLDEPAAGLDSRESLALGEELKQVVAQGITLLMVEHDMGLVLSVCDEIKVLDFGKLIASGDPDHIKTNERVIHAYLGADDSNEIEEASASGLMAS